MMEAVLGSIPEGMGRRASRDAEKVDGAAIWGSVAALTCGVDDACRAASGQLCHPACAMQYFRRRGKLAWPEAASSRKSVRAVQRLSGLQKHIAASCDASLKPVLQSLVRP